MNHDYTATVGYFEDGTLGDVFVRSGKAGSHSSILMLEASICLSVAFQYGAKPSDMRRSMPHAGDPKSGGLGAPEGPIGTLLEILEKEERERARKELSE